MEVRVSRIEFGVEIRGFGLGEREIREVANSVISEYKNEWDVSDIRNGRNGHIELYLEHNYREDLMDGELFEGIKHRAKEIAKLIERKLADYARIKPFLSIYTSCNGYNGNGRSEAKEIMRKVGIPVIS